MPDSLSSSRAPCQSSLPCARRHDASCGHCVSGRGGVLTVATTYARRPSAPGRCSRAVPSAGPPRSARYDHRFMLRRLFILFSVLIALMTAAVACLGVRSLYVSDELNVGNENGIWSLTSERGRLELKRERWGYVKFSLLWGSYTGPAEQRTWHRLHVLTSPPTSEEVVASLARHVKPMSAMNLEYHAPRVWSVSHAGVAMSLVGVLPVLFALRAGTRRVMHAVRRRSGHCPTCRYDLRATPE